MHVDRSYLHILAPAYAFLHAQETGLRVTQTGDAPNRERRKREARGDSRDSAAEETRVEAEAHQPSSEHALDIVV